ncbi:hypothetical protein Atai01_45230 [Amycolatopsis taiwanensis]|uniref:Uncharacterized protein n=1 Tax=Amycolatopsis taiwanensis TaxID=342230 RepID=A0A9W6R2E9_9PSEU|nr:hypothetical protein Atai01_45230 [Amycolatopsis taiwanensis]
MDTQPRLALRIETAAGEPAAVPGLQRWAATIGDPAWQIEATLLTPAARVGVAEAVLATAATTDRDRAFRGLLQPAPVRLRRLRPSLDVVRSALVYPALMVGRTLAEGHREPFADRGQAPGPANHRVVRIDQDHRLRELRTQPGRQAGAGVGVAVRDRVQAAHAIGSAVADSSRNPAAASARRASSTPRCE